MLQRVLLLLNAGKEDKTERGWEEWTSLTNKEYELHCVFNYWKSLHCFWSSKRFVFPVKCKLNSQGRRASKWKARPWVMFCKTVQLFTWTIFEKRHFVPLKKRNSMLRSVSTNINHTYCYPICSGRGIVHEYHITMLHFLVTFAHINYLFFLLNIFYILKSPRIGKIMSFSKANISFDTCTTF